MKITQKQSKELLIHLEDLLSELDVEVVLTKGKIIVEGNVNTSKLKKLLGFLPEDWEVEFKKREFTYIPYYPQVYPWNDTNRWWEGDTTQPYYTKIGDTIRVGYLIETVN